MIENADNSTIWKTVRFLLESEKLKQVLRQTKPLGEDRYENSAEHSWQTSLAAMVLLEDAPKHLDRLKVVKMLIIHDIVEIDAGDVFVYDAEARAAASEAEEQAARRLFGMLDDPLGDQLYSLWMEFEAGETAEAKFAKAADRVMPVLQNLSAGGQSWKEHGITKAQVIDRNAPIADASAELWRVVEQQIRQAAFIKE